MKICKKQKDKFTTGFTLIETLVAISIFTTSVLTLIIILSQGITSTIYAKDKIIANYLAQEGIEYVRNIRDTYALSADGWTNFKTNSATCIQANGCYFTDISLASFSACGSSCPVLKYDSSSGTYNNYNSGTDSVFTRTIKINTIPGYLDEVNVVSSVSWNQGSGSHNVTLSENLFNWVE